MGVASKRLEIRKILPDYPDREEEENPFNNLATEGQKALQRYIRIKIRNSPYKSMESINSMSVFERLSPQTTNY